MKRLMVAAAMMFTAANAMADSYPVYKCGPLVDSKGNADTTEAFQVLKVVNRVEILQTNVDGSASVVETSLQSDGSYLFECLKLTPSFTGKNLTSFKLEGVCEDADSSATCPLLPLY